MANLLDVGNNETEYSILFRSARVIDPRVCVDAVTNVYWRGGRMTRDPGSGRVHDIRADGWIICPGLIDMHVHLREPGGEHKETIETGGAAAVAGGFATVACMPNTTPAIDSPEWVAEVIRRAERSDRCRVWPIAAITCARRGKELTDFDALVAAGAAALSDDGDGVEDDDVMRRAGQLARRLNTTLVQHCEFHPLSAGGVINKGPASDRLHLPPWDPRGETAMIERDVRLAHDEGFRYHAAHVSTADGVACIREAKRAGLAVTAEVCPHHLLLADEDIPSDDANFKMNPPLRSRADVDACRMGLFDGTIDCIVTDHAPHTVEEKAMGFRGAPFGIVGLETCVPLAARAMVESGLLTWPALIERMTVAPARVLQRECPTFASPGVHDVTIIDPQAAWTIDAQQFRSKGRNTPFNGWNVRGQVVATMVAGRLRFVHDRVRDVFAPLMHG